MIPLPVYLSNDVLTLNQCKDVPGYVDVYLTGLEQNQSTILTSDGFTCTMII